MSTTYKRPSISVLLDAIAGVTFAASASAIAAHFIFKTNAENYLALGVAGIGMGIVYIAFARVIACLGQSAYYAERLIHAAANDIYPRLKGIEEKLSSSAARAAAPSETAQAAQAAAMVHYYYSEGDTAEGPVTLGDLRSLHFAGVIDNATLIYREGDTAWTPFEEIYEAVAV